MATATMATAVGAAAILYYTLNRKLQSDMPRDDGEDNSVEERKDYSSRRNGASRRPAQAPATWMETISTLSETLRFTYSETLGKWPLGDLAFGISFLLKSQGNLPASSIYAGSDSIQLTGTEVISELRYLLNLLTLCWHFSKKPFTLYLKEVGFSEEDVLLQKPKAGILKPAFTVLVDKNEKCFLLLIRGTHSIKDTLTAVTGAIVPFHHTVIQEGGVRDCVLGYAHCGMVAAARWIAKLAIPCLTRALAEHPDYKIKIVGHSLGGGTAAILTYMLREKKEFSMSTCIAFAPAACITWELAESGVHFITSVINGADLVPTFSVASVDDLRSEVTASAWVNDLRNQIEKTRFLSTVYRSASALSSHLPSIESARARVAVAGAILRPVSSKTQVVMKGARNVAQAAWKRPSFQLSSWSCMGARRRTSHNEIIKSESTTVITDGEPHGASCDEMIRASSEFVTWDSNLDCSSSSQNISDRDDPMGQDRSEDRITEPMTEHELWKQLEHELEGMNEEMREEERIAADEGTCISDSSISMKLESCRFYPPGKVMHILNLFTQDEHRDDDEESEGRSQEEEIGIFLTPRSLYGKMRLSQTMINDHYMPMYRKQIEKLISELEKKSTNE